MMRAAPALIMLQMTTIFSCKFRSHIHPEIRNEFEKEPHTQKTSALCPEQRYKIEKKNQKNIILIDVILCLPQTVNQSCQAPSLTYLKTNRVNVIDRNDIDEDEETEPTKIPNSTCIQSYSTYEVDGHEPFLIPSGCKCHNVKYL